MKRGLAVVLFLFGISLPLYAALPCCTITAVDSRTGLVTGKENATGRMFQFQAGNAALLKLLRPGTEVYANFTGKQVSLDGRNSCCQIVSVSAGPPSATTPVAPRTAVPATAAAPTAAMPAVQAAEALQPTAVAAKTPAATALKAGPNAIVAGGIVASQVNIGGGTFQRCCTLTAVQGILGSPVAVWAAKENELGWSFGLELLPHFPNLPKGFAAGSPLWVNFGTNQVSCDGATICGSVFAAQPVNFVQTTILDVLPIGVIYVPPGDPQDPVGSSIVAKQIFSLTNMTATVNSTVNVTTTPGVALGYGIDIAGPGVPATNPTTSSTSQTVSESQMVGEAAQGPGGYPGSNDLVWFYVNPAYDVTYIGVWLYNGGQYPVVASPGQIVSIVPHPKQLRGECGPQWQFAHATIGELQAYAAGDTSNADAGFLNLICKGAQTAAPTGGGVKSVFGAVPATPAQKLIALDPMANLATRFQLPPVLGQSPPTTIMDPSSVPGTPKRFQPLALSTDDPGSSYPVTYCGTDAPFNFADLASQTSTTSNSTVTQFQGNPVLLLNPVAIAATAVNAAAGIKLPVPGSAVGLGTAWTITSTYTTATTKGTAWNVTGNFGSGMYGTKGFPSCDGAPAFSTTLYYDWVNHTVLFWSVPVPGTGTEVQGVIPSPGRASRVVFTSASGGHPLVVLPNANGQFHAKLAPGSYRYYVSQAGGRSAALSLTVPANQSVPLQLPAMGKETAVLAGRE